MTDNSPLNSAGTFPNSTTTPATMPTPAAPVLREVSASLLAVSLEQAAEMLSTSKRTIERERDRGKLKCLRLGRLWKVRVAELHAYLRKKEIEAAR